MVKLVEVEHAPCQHLHSSNYDPSKVIRGVAVEPLTNNQMWCFDCREFFVPKQIPHRYTLPQLQQLASTYIEQLPAPVSRLSVSLMMSAWLKWMEKREKEGE